jgi:hypothetical protein
VPVTRIHRVETRAPINSKLPDRQFGRWQRRRNARNGCWGEAQNTNRDLQTKLTHGRLSRDEAVNRSDTEKLAGEHALRSVQAELEAKRVARRQAKAAITEALAALCGRSRGGKARFLIAVIKLCECAARVSLFG